MPLAVKPILVRRRASLDGHFFYVCREVVGAWGAVPEGLGFPFKVDLVGL